MAYITQETKKLINAALKDVIPKSWKWSLGVDNHSSLVLTVSSGDIELPSTDVSFNHYWIDKNSLNKQSQVLMKKIIETINKTGSNYNNSDIQTDYFDVGFYINIHFGRWNKPFVSTGNKYKYQ